jgi:hypothetical protein
MRTNPKLRHIPLDNAARLGLQDLSESTVDSFVHALDSGYITYFTEILMSEAQPGIDMQLAGARAVVRRWIAEITWDQAEEKPAVHYIRPSDLLLVYQALVGPIASLKKFSRLMGIHGLANRVASRNGVSERIHPIHWNITKEELEACKREFLHDPAKVVQMNR